MVNWLFGDGFDLYQAATDSYQSYWDSGDSARIAFTALSGGRFTGSRGLVFIATSATAAGLTKSSGSNDAIHHFVCAIKYSTAATNNGQWLTLFDGTTAQCSVVFKDNGDIILTSGASTGTTLDTYSNAMPLANTWYAFEIEVVINNTTGSWAIRKNGSVSNDHSASGLNTRGGTSNNYANKLSVGASRVTFTLDDLLWRSDSSSVPWVGDIRCFTRLPAADSSVTWTPSATSPVTVTPFLQSTTQNITSGLARYSPFIATCDGTVGSAIISLGAGYTGNMKCTIFNDSAGAPGTVLASASAVTNPVLGNNTFTFGSPPSVTQGTLYWIGLDSDTGVAGGWNVSNISSTGYNTSGAQSTTAYASFPAANPTLTSSTAPQLIFTVNITPTTTANANMVAEQVEDQALTYVSDSNVGDADLYTPQAIAATPSSIVAVITRAFCQKSDAGTRAISLQVKSGTTTSIGATTALSTGWNWIYKTDVVDPDTGSAWTATGVNNCTFGPKLTA